MDTQWQVYCSNGYVLIISTDICCHFSDPLMAMATCAYIKINVKILMDGLQSVGDQ